MSSHNPLRDMLRRAVRPTAKPTAPILDSTQPPVVEGQPDAPGVLDSAGANAPDPTLDDVGGPAGSYTDTDLALKGVAAVQEWGASGGDLDEGEGPADRLLAMLIGIADENIDGELSDDEAEIYEIAANAAWDYLGSLGASDDDLSAVFNDEDNEAAERVLELIVGKLPDGDEAEGTAMDDFVFGDGSDESALDGVMTDGAMLDAVYRKTLVVRNGKKVRINKRIAGHVKLSAKQKLAVRKMLRKSHSAVAQLRRRKSLKVRRSSSM